ncbi:ion transporter [Spirochaeta cellobiosiphila]|uniref:ion transporter n=1 Tax=Spirochaeta cellobiosiphila TaxID=504483 RepID=UPI0003FC52FE|nr:ion transporter [Spirochaeta cellobiosiphila]
MFNISLGKIAFLSYDDDIVTFIVLRKKLFNIIEPAGNKFETPSLVFDKTVIILISINIISIILESFPQVNEQYESLFRLIEIISISFFTIEYLLRLLTSDLKYPASSRLRSLLYYVLTPMALIDLFAIIPFYIPFLFTIDLRFIRVLRLTRLLRILKINRYSNSLQLLGRVLNRAKEKLIVTMFVTFILMLFASTAMFYLETDKQPEAFPNIIASFWWAIATLTTVGYGDVYPITLWGKILAGIVALLGVGLVALPTGIISSGFIEEYESTLHISKSIKKARNGGNSNKSKVQRLLRTKRRKSNR